MSIEKKVPEIRFKGFSGEWKKQELNNVVEFFSGLTYSPNDVRKTGTLVLRSSNVKNGQLQLADNVYVNPEVVNCNNVIKGDVIVVVRNGSRSLIGKHAQVTSCMDNTVIGAFMTGIRSKEAKFINALLDTNKFNAEVEKNLGATINQITTGSFKKMRFAFPVDIEQTVIGNYFQKLDILINQYQQKHDKLSNIKKAMLEKMFPKQGETTPEIRFKGFNGKWEEVLFGACFVNVSNNTLSRAELNYNTGLAKNIHYGDILIKFGEILDAHHELLPFINNHDVVNKLNNAALRDGDIIIADAAEDSTVGKCTELFNIGEQLILSGLHTIAVRPTLSFASKYLGYYLNSRSYHDQLLPLMQGTKVLSISKAAIQNTSITFPKSSEEQAAIGNYFQKLDALINQHQQQITKLNNIKQACLSKMFV
ncbi:restriction endonuclease subunit S [Providencia stuartii]|uniref:restriction endonuclease subunit S n=1 Tax=Providencia stuartii TaxID=588 RepID=UPI0014952C00|nr:restriction endonuclease subunit S [Providencia stuartii]NPD42529.1 restriction endonuclease subunit S [Providencia stuartii]NPD95726.1 restriction endonuclease subunit S [Providencia stuartii]